MSARTRRGLFPARSMRVDMSPMIDLVFLLLIFFMVSSTLITFRQDQNVKVPIASAGKVPNLVQNRIIVNVYAGGAIKSEDGKPLSLLAVENTMRQAKAVNPAIRLHIRADRIAAHHMVKDVIDASARGGVANVIFSTYVTGK